jgi:hypothetical protein
LSACVVPICERLKQWERFFTIHEILKAKGWALSFLRIKNIW